MDWFDKLLSAGEIWADVEKSKVQSEAQKESEKAAAELAGVQAAAATPNYTGMAKVAVIGVGSVLGLLLVYNIAKKVV